MHLNISRLKQEAKLRKIKKDIQTAKLSTIKATARWKVAQKHTKKAAKKLKKNKNAKKNIITESDREERVRSKLSEQRISSSKSTSYSINSGRTSPSRSVSTTYNRKVMADEWENTKTLTSRNLASVSATVFVKQKMMLDELSGSFKEDSPLQNSVSSRKSASASAHAMSVSRKMMLAEITQMESGFVYKRLKSSKRHSL